ncbi:zinc-ribbon domain-containing protein [Streptomyces sp. KD18]|nr:zinc-ribbon domain-containing protein [Streptomyces sp. KD18]
MRYQALSSENPELAALWHPSMNGALTPAEVTAGANVPVWWLCPAGHEPWSAQVAQVFTGRQGFPRCRKHMRLLAGDGTVRRAPARPHRRRAAVPAADAARPVPARQALPGGPRPGRLRWSSTDRTGTAIPRSATGSRRRLWNATGPAGWW